MKSALSAKVPAPDETLPQNKVLQERTLQELDKRQHHHAPNLTNATLSLAPITTQEFLKQLGEAATRAGIKEKHRERLLQIPLTELSALCQVVAFEHLLERIAERAHGLFHDGTYTLGDKFRLERIPTDIHKTLKHSKGRLMNLASASQTQPSSHNERFQLSIDEITHRMGGFCTKLLTVSMLYLDAAEDPKEREHLLSTFGKPKKLLQGGKMTRYAVQALGIAGGEDIQSVVEKSFKESRRRYCDRTSEKVHLKFNETSGRRQTPEHYHVTFQVVSELIANAVQATVTQGGGTVRVQVHFGSNFQTISIQNGGRIPEEIRAKIWSPGFSTKDSVTLPDGTPNATRGMGLYNCKRLAEQVGGRLELAPTGVDKTTCFIFEVPFQEEHEQQNLPLTTKQCMALFRDNLDLRRALLRLTKRLIP